MTTSLYRKAGAIPVEVTNIPELCSWWDAENVIFGRTINPYESTKGVGGSSGISLFLGSFGYTFFIKFCLSTLLKS